MGTEYDKEMKENESNYQQAMNDPAKSESEKDALQKELKRKMDLQQTIASEVHSSVELHVAEK
jgi:hypothetical protein